MTKISAYSRNTGLRNYSPVSPTTQSTKHYFRITHYCIDSSTKNRCNFISSSNKSSRENNQMNFAST